MKNIILITLLVSFLGLGFSQDSTNNDWKVYPSSSDSAQAMDTVYRLKKATTPGKVTVKKDKRIDKVSDDLAGGVSKKAVIKGYRVQVISSSTKATVDQARAKCMATGHKTYIDYKAPNFRLRVGNFRTRLDGEKFQFEIKEAFPNTLIISDWIELPLIEE